MSNETTNGAEARESQVYSAIGRLKNELDSVEDSMNILVERIIPILRDEDDKEAKAAEPRVSRNVPLVRIIDEQMYRVHELSEKIKYLIDRCEL